MPRGARRSSRRPASSPPRPASRSRRPPGWRRPSEGGGATAGGSDYEGQIPRQSWNVTEHQNTKNYEKLGFQFKISFRIHFYQFLLNFCSIFPLNFKEKTAAKFGGKTLKNMYQQGLHAQNHM